jgi:hypothetical protein
MGKGRGKKDDDAGEDSSFAANGTKAAVGMVLLLMAVVGWGLHERSVLLAHTAKLHAQLETYSQSQVRDVVGDGSDREEYGNTRRRSRASPRTSTPTVCKISTASDRRACSTWHPCALSASRLECTARARPTRRVQRHLSGTAGPPAHLTGRSCGGTGLWRRWTAGNRYTSGVALSRVHTAHNEALACGFFSSAGQPNTHPSICGSPADSSQQLTRVSPRESRYLCPGIPTERKKLSRLEVSSLCVRRGGRQWGSSFTAAAHSCMGNVCTGHCATSAQLRHLTVKRPCADDAATMMYVLPP